MAAAKKNDDDSKVVIKPNEIIEAIEFAQRANPDDKYGTGALQFDIEHARHQRQGKTHWIPTRINVLRDGARRWLPIRVMVIRLETKSRIPSPKEREEKASSSDEDVRIQAQFRDGDVYTEKLPGGGVVSQEFGRAMRMLHYAWRMKAQDAYKQNRAFKDLVDTPKRFGVLQTHRDKVSKTAKDSKFTQDEKPPGERDIPEEDDSEDPSNQPSKKVALPDGEAIIRVLIEFAQETDKKGKKQKIQPDAKPKIDIYDATKRIAAPTKGTIPYEKATLDGEEIVYENIHEFLRPGSLVTGVIDLSSTTLSNMGISIPGKFTDMIVTPGKAGGQRSFADALLGVLDDNASDEDEDGDAGKNAALAAAEEAAKPATKADSASKPPKAESAPKAEEPKKKAPAETAAGKPPKAESAPKAEEPKKKPVKATPPPPSDSDSDTDADSKRPLRPSRK